MLGTLLFDDKGKEFLEEPQHPIGSEVVFGILEFVPLCHLHLSLGFGLRIMLVF